MYILIKESIPLGFTIIAAAHSSLAAYLAFENTLEVRKWLTGPFYKVVCRVSDEEFERAKGVSDHVIITESALENQEVAIAYKPRENWPKWFKYLSLLKPNGGST
jgi:hypothetical protein